MLRIYDQREIIQISLASSSNLSHAHSLMRVYVLIVVHRVHRTRWHAMHMGNGTCA